MTLGKVVQVVTNNSTSRGHSSPCAAHCSGFLIRDITKIETIKTDEEFVHLLCFRLAYGTWGPNCVWPLLHEHLPRFPRADQNVCDLCSLIIFHSSSHSSCLWHCLWQPELYILPHSHQLLWGYWGNLQLYVFCSINGLDENCSQMRVNDKIWKGLLGDGRSLITRVCNPSLSKSS